MKNKKGEFISLFVYKFSNGQYYSQMSNQLSIIIIILISVYLLSVNLYGFILVKAQRNQLCSQDIIEQVENKEEDEEEDKKNESKFISIPQEAIKDFKIYLAGFLGGALAIYLSMFIFKYRLTNLGFMLLMPVFIAITVCLIVLLFQSGLFTVI